MQRTHTNAYTAARMLKTHLLHKFYTKHEAKQFLTRIISNIIISIVSYPYSHIKLRSYILAKKRHHQRIVLFFYIC
jgi:hypothetical protein